MISRFVMGLENDYWVMINIRDLEIIAVEHLTDIPTACQARYY